VIYAPDLELRVPEIPGDGISRGDDPPLGHAPARRGRV